MKNVLIMLFFLPVFAGGQAHNNLVINDTSNECIAALIVPVQFSVSDTSKAVLLSMTIIKSPTFSFVRWYYTVRNAKGDIQKSGNLEMRDTAFSDYAEALGSGDRLYPLFWAASLINVELDGL